MDRQNVLFGALIPSLAAIAVSLGCASAPAPAPEPEPAASRASLSPTPVLPEGGCPGYPDMDGEVQLEGALAEARATGRRVLVVVGDNTCPWCRALCEEMQLPEIAAEVDRGFVVVKIDIGHGERNVRLQQRIRLSSVGIPHLVVLDANEKIYVSQNTAEFMQPGGKTAHVPELLLDFFRAWTGPPAPPSPS